MRTNVFSGLLLISGISAFVPPPTDVVVDCQNTKVFAKWNYTDKQQQTIFSVILWFDGRASQNCKKNTTAHQVDLSDCIWSSEEEYMKFIHVTVTAVLGDNHSKNVSSNTFSFNHLKTVNKQCTLAFPPVDVNEDDSKFTVHFQNPLVFYEKQFPVRKLDLKFTVVPVENVSLEHTEGFCSAKENSCKHDVRLPSGVVTCFAIKGMLLDPIMGVEQLILNEIQACPSHSSVKEVWIATVVILSITAFIIVVAVFFVCKTRAWTMQSSALPKSLQHVGKACVMKYGILPREDINIATVQRPQVKCSESSEDTNSSENIQKGSNCSLDTSGQSLYAERCFSEWDPQELLCETKGYENTSNLSVKTDSTSLESEEEQGESFSIYDAPHMLGSDIGDEDHVTGDTEN
ncbi:interferon gamma receptor 1-like [Gouania willdenowi]|uniref:Interferon gamma receptor 1-like n=1 Tax=Gouania willdenowi TaxID=441366 RepID=A0A8C5H6U4_GOUWI|nr:interferon gamma receptor 1-like [Gouania willdenowi]